MTVAGPELEGLTVDQPAASVRVLLPPPGESALVVPEWTGNEFLLPGDRRPVIRTLTPWRLHGDGRALDLGIVLHGSGAASGWAASAAPGDPVAVSGTARGYDVDAAVAAGATGFFLAGDETAIPAITQLLAALPAGVAVRVAVEVGHPDARLALDGGRADVDWHDLEPGRSPGDALVEAVRAADLPAGTRVWVAGEAAAVQRARRHLFEERGLARAQATVRGYWKHGRAGGDDDG